MRNTYFVLMSRACFVRVTGLCFFVDCCKNLRYPIDKLNIGNYNELKCFKMIP